MLSKHFKIVSEVFKNAFLHFLRNERIQLQYISQRKHMSQRQSDGQTDRQTNRQKDRKKDTQSDGETE